MANKVVLCWRAKTPRGWRHFPVLFHKQHGKTLPRHGWVLDNGREVEYPEGRYELRSYSAGKMIYTALDATHPAEAQWALLRAQREAQTKKAQKADPLHFIQGAIDAYLRDLEQRKKAEMQEKAAHVLAEFKVFCVEPSAHGRLPTTIHTRKITREHILGFHAWLRKEKNNSERTIADKHARILAWLRFCKIDTSWFPPAPKFEKTLPTIYEQSQIDGCHSVRVRRVNRGDANYSGLRQLLFLFYRQVYFSHRIHQRRKRLRRALLHVLRGLLNPLCDRTCPHAAVVHFLILPFFWFGAFKEYNRKNVAC
jgi:hypothetical protein